MTGLLGTILAALLFGTASRLHRRERLPEALVILERVLRVVEPAGTPARISAKLSALRLRSVIAAKLGDVPLARASLVDALAVWADVKRRGGLASRLGSMEEWERWARGYLAETEG